MNPPDYNISWSNCTDVKKTKLAKYYMDKNENIYINPHEGLIIKENGCEVISNFLNAHTDIKDDLFNQNTVCEEFALQTILKNETDDKTPVINLNYGSIVEDNVPAPDDPNTPFCVRKTTRN
jgi:hypothetical protein